MILQVDPTSPNIGPHITTRRNDLQVNVPEALNLWPKALWHSMKSWLFFSYLSGSSKLAIIIIPHIILGKILIPGISNNQPKYPSIPYDPWSLGPWPRPMGPATGPPKKRKLHCDGPYDAMLGDWMGGMGRGKVGSTTGCPWKLVTS